MMKRFRKALSLLLSIVMLASMMVTGLSISASASGGKELVVYFANWSIYTQGKDAEVASLPWDKVTYINHAFFQIDKNGEGDYSISSTDPTADIENLTPSAVDPTLPVNHFAQYEHFSALYPDVNIMISIGGWTRCGYFSEMANTAAGRASFIDSCIDYMDTYSWIDGIDVDWEYPGVARAPENASDQGCPVVGNDFENYTLLLKEMREAFDAKYGVGGKKLTVCESVNYNTLSNQDCANFHQYVDLINVMSYDMTGTYDSVTGHQSCVYNSDPAGYSVDSGVDYLLDCGVPASKINIGSPFYCHGWGSVTPDGSGNVVGVPGSSQGYHGDVKWYVLRKLQSRAVNPGEPGWHYNFDPVSKASYLYNDNPDSQWYKNFLTYDSEAAIVSKAQYIQDKGLAGIIVWEVNGDSVEDNYPLLSLLSNSLGIYDGEVPMYTGASVPEPDPINPGGSGPALPDPIYEIEQGKNDVYTKFPTGTHVYYKGAVYKSLLDGADNWSGNLPDGTWGPDCWQKIFDVKPYISQEENGGSWAYSANKDDHILYNPDRDVNAEVYLALADVSNTANDAPDGIWGGSVWQYETTIVLLEAPGGLKASVREAEIGTGSISFPAGTQIFFDGAVWESKSPSANDAEENMPGGALANVYWKKVADITEYNPEGNTAGDYVLYNPDNSTVAPVYKALNDTASNPTTDTEGNWELATTITFIYHPKYADGATVATLEADPLYFGQFQTRPFILDGVEITSYPAGAVVVYNDKYYENYVPGSSAWNDGWEPNVHANWHQILIKEEGDEREPTMQCPIYEIEEGKNWVFTTYPTGTLVYYKGAVYESLLDTADNWSGNLPDGEWGSGCWEKKFDVVPYISNAEKGYWDWAAHTGDYVLYNPNKSVNADLYLALTDISNTENDAPDGIWGGDVWQYATTIILLEAPGAIRDPINEAVLGDGSVTFPVGTQIYFDNAIWASKNSAANDFESNMPGGEWADSCWNKLIDVSDFDNQTAAGENVLYNPTNGYTPQVYRALVDTDTTPDNAPEGVWEYVTTVKLVYHPKYADGASVLTLVKDPLFFGEFQTRPFILDGVEIASYPAGSVVSYNGKYYENYVDGSSAWDDGWQPDVHGNWHEIDVYDITLYRLSGTSRVDTAIITSQAGWDDGEAPVAVLANGYSFADSLAGTPLAYAYNAPLLLTAGKTLESSVLAELERLGAEKVIILGGVGAVSEEVELALTDYEVERIFGTSRADTAKAIADKLIEVTGETPTEAFLTYGYNFADALAISPVAAIKGAPVLYVAADGSLYDATSSFLADNSIASVTILGGSGAVGTACEENLAALNVQSSRIYGTSRCDTALAIVNAYDDLFDNSAQTVAFATCESFADALSGGVLTALCRTPLLLVSDTRPAAEGIEDYIASYDVRNVIIFGGEGALKTETVVNLL